jgi:hypothetical protein
MVVLGKVASMTDAASRVISWAISGLNAVMPEVTSSAQM